MRELASLAFESNDRDEGAPADPRSPHPEVLPDLPAPAPSAGWPPADAEIFEALQRAWQDGSWGRYEGPHGDALASALRDMFRVRHVLLCCSGTIAVELALRALKVGPGDEVLLAGYDFPGNFRAIEAVGALPVLLDLDPQNWNLDPDQLEQACSPRTRAVIVSHLHGGLVPMDRVRTWAEQRGLSIVEDACQAAGARIEGRPAGGWGHAGVISFGGSKLLTAGRGGAVLLEEDASYQRAKVWANRGNQAYPLSELQAAVLLPQLRRLEERTHQRAAAAARFWRRLQGVPGVRPLRNRVRDGLAAYYKLGMQLVPEELCGAEREVLLERTRPLGLPLEAGFRGFALRGRRARASGPLTQARLAAARMLVLHHPLLLAGDAAVDRAASLLAEALRSLARSTS
jgi:dTDP-4-amino-4,6-dideoxygalactose transaminase